MLYTKSKNTYFAKPKDDPKDRIELEVGDSKETEFFPQQKIMRWDNECNVSFRLVHDELNPTVSKQGDKIKWQGEKVEAEIYPLEEGQEFEIILKEKPLSNVVQFTIEDKDVEYFYQPELTAEEIADGAERPENVVGSYAVYAKTPKHNYVGGKEYKTGKIGHIYRPRIEDSKGDWVWGELKIENGLLSVTIPQEFLANAVYPVRHAAGLTFGYETGGSSETYGNANYLLGSVFTSPAGANATVDKLTAWVGDSFSTHEFKCVLVLHSNLNIVTNGITNVGAKGAESGERWRDAVFATPPTITENTAYVLMGVENDGWVFWSYDTGDADQGHTDTTNSFSSPTSPTDASHSTNKYSIYATYTAGGSAYTLTASAGSFTLTGNASTLKKALKITASVGTFTLTGVSANLERGYTLIASAGTFTLTGIATAFKKALKLATSVGEFALTGISANLKRGYTISTSVGEFTLTGISVTLKKGYNLITETSSFILTGINTTFSKTLSLATETGEFILTGNNVILDRRGQAGLTILGITL